MNKYVAALWLVFFVISPAQATSCLPLTVNQDFAFSDVVVAAEVRDVSVTASPNQTDMFRQTVLWRVHESWKGKHLYGRDFTTRTPINCPTCATYKLKPGSSMVLYLTGREPYQLNWCGRTNKLEFSLKDIPALYKLSGAHNGT
jgi:hypothetical protein